MNAQNRDIFSVNAVFSIWILFFLRRVFFSYFCGLLVTWNKHFTVGHWNWSW